MIFRLLLASMLALSLSAQTKNYNLNVVHLGRLDASSATGTKPFREVASASGSCSLAGEIVSITGSAEIYKCPSNTMTWTLITGSGESITVSAPLSRVGDVISCPTCVTTSATSLTQLASIGVVTSGVWQGTRVALPYGGTSSDLSATGPGFLKQATTGAVVTVVMPAYSDLTGVPSTFAPSAHNTNHQHGGSDEIATATPGANAIPKADGSNKFAAGWLTEVLTLANLSDVTGKQGNGTLVATVCGTLVQGNALTVDSSGCVVDSESTPGGGGGAAYNAITSGTNTQAAMVVGSGASIAATGLGTIAATSLSALTGLPNQADGTILANISGGSAPASATTFAALGGKFSVDNLSNSRVSKTDNTHIAYAGGPIQCLKTLVSTSAIASITLASGTSGTVHVGVDCEDGGAIIIARGSTLDITGSGFTESTLDDFSTLPRVKLIASVPVSSSVFGTVAEARTFVDVQVPVPGDGLAESITVDGLQELTVNSTVIRKGTTFPGGFIVFGTGASSALQDTDDVSKVWRNTTGGAITINNLYCAADSGAPTIQIQKDDGSVTNMLSSNLSCGTSEATTSTFVSGENILAAGDYIKFVTVSASAGGGSPTQVTVSFGFTRN